MSQEQPSIITLLAERDEARKRVKELEDAILSTPKKWDNGFDGYVCPFCETLFGENHYGDCILHTIIGSET